MNLDTINAYLQWKFPNRTQPSRPTSMSNLVGDLLKQGIVTLVAVDEKVNLVSKIIPDYEKELKAEGYLRFNQLGSYGVVWASLDILIPDFYETRISSPMDEQRKKLIQLIEKFRKRLNL